MKTKNQKEKPAYNVRQNSLYIIQRAWARDKSVMLVVLAQIFLTVAVSTVALFLPKTVVAQITNGTEVKTLVITVLGFTVVTMALQAAKNFFDFIAQPRRAGLRMKFFQDIMFKTITADYAHLDEKIFTDAKQKAHDVTYSGHNSVEQIYYSFAGLGSSLLGFVVYVILLIAVNPLVLLITAATTLLSVWARRQSNKWQHNHDAESATFNKRLWYMNGIGNDYSLAKDIRLFSMANWLCDLYAANLKLSFDFNRRVQTKHLIADAVDCVAIFLREGVAYAYLIWQALYFGLPVDSFVLLFSAIGGFSGWVSGILSEYSALSMHSLNICRLRAFLEYPDTFKNEDGLPIAPEKGKGYALELKNVSFRYKGAAENALENINLKIKPGEKLAVVGLNGAGKTTLIKLICGFYDPTEGIVLLNGQDIRQYNRKDYYTLFTAVFQDFNILPLSIAENISQQWENETDPEKIEHCLAMADLDKKINALPNGISSLLIKSVNTDAVELSGGETQRLMLARALYKDAPVLILDEPTAALDPIAESNLYNKYNDLSAGKTSVYISHRLASTRFCDRIILVANKTIQESGTHETLMKQRGTYAELFEIQSKYYQEDKEESLL